MHYGAQKDRIRVKVRARVRGLVRLRRINVNERICLCAAVVVHELEGGNIEAEAVDSLGSAT